ncbi:MAG TPA: hypothetical protein VMW46_00150 [Candidatus Desulfaltia sp.]|nr:hypothetical protein [Candidatus Desulfaltia sp.]
MKKAWSGILAALLVLVSSAALPGQEEDPDKIAPELRHRFLNLSLYYPVSMNPSKHDTANINLTFLYGRLGSVRGLDLCLGVTRLENSLYGVQLAGLAGTAGKSMKGLQAAGLLCAAGERGQGVQLAGLGSVSGEEFAGLQAAGLFSVAGEHLEGVQVSGLFSVAGQAAKGFQVSGLFSVAGETLEGFQASGLFSVAGENLDGVQISGLFNVAGEDSRAFQLAGLMNVGGGTCRGVQIGLFNVAGRLTGVQVGVVNVAGELEGLPIGLVNLTRKEDRRIRLAAWAGNTALFNVGVKFWARRFYSILYAGTINMTQDGQSCLAYGFQYGYGLPLRRMSGAGREMRVNLDAGYLYLDNSTVFRHLEGTPDRHVLSARGGLEVVLSSRVSLVAGLGLRYAIDYGQSFGSGRFSPLVFAGVELF